MDTDYVVKGNVVDKVVKMLFLPFGHEGMVGIIFQQRKCSACNRIQHKDG